MKQLKNLFIVAILFLGFQGANAQAKSAHVDVREIMSKMPAMVDAQKQLETLGKTYDTDFNSMVAEYRSKLQKYEEEANDKSAKENEARGLELQDMEKRIGDYRQTAERELEKKREDLLAPIMDKAKKAIEKVGKAKGYQYVFDGSTLLLSDGPDLTADVKKELGF
jgi:outer membrane protein